MNNEVGVSDIVDVVEAAGGQVESIGILDDSGFMTASFPLPKDHWLYKKTDDGFTPSPPMGLRCGLANGLSTRYRDVLSRHVINAVRYGVKCATNNGQVEDFDPDALVQNTIVGLFGYHTDDGLSSDDWANPSPVPPGLHAVLNSLIGGLCERPELFCEPERDPAMEATCTDAGVGGLTRTVEQRADVQTPEFTPRPSNER